MSGHTGGVRLFIGVWPDDCVRGALAAMDRPTDVSVRWVEAARLHVTLAFLGERDEAGAEAAAGAVRRALAGMRSAPEAVVGPATELLGRSVLSVRVAGLDELAAAVRSELVSAGVFADDDKPFYGHLTVARGRGGRPVPRRLAGIAVSGRWRVESVEMVRSVLEPSGASYETVAALAVGA